MLKWIPAGEIAAHKEAWADHSVVKEILLCLSNGIVTVGVYDVQKTSFFANSFWDGEKCCYGYTDDVVMFAMFNRPLQEKH